MKTITMRAALVAMALVLTTAAGAMAQKSTANPYRWWSVCGGAASTFSTCASVDIELLAPGHMQLRIWNRSGDVTRKGSLTPTNTVFSGIGFFNMGNIRAQLGTVSASGGQLGEGPAAWRLVNDDYLDKYGNVVESKYGMKAPNGVELELGLMAPSGRDDANSGIVRDCSITTSGFNYWSNPCNAAPNWNDNAGWVVFDFNFTGDWGDLQRTQLVLYGRDPSDNTVITDCTTGGTQQNCYNDVVPEPISMTLIGTGLLGVGLARRRRRKDNDIETV